VSDTDKHASFLRHLIRYQHNIFCVIGLPNISNILSKNESFKRRKILISDSQTLLLIVLPKGAKDMPGPEIYTLFNLVLNFLVIR